MPAAMPAPSPLSLCRDEVFACLHLANEDGVAHFLHITVSYERALLRRVTEALPWLSRGRGGSGSREHPTPHHTLYRESCQRAGRPREATASSSFLPPAAASAPAQQGSAYEETIHAALSLDTHEKHLYLWHLLSRRSPPPSPAAVADPWRGGPCAE